MMTIGDVAVLALGMLVAFWIAEKIHEIELKISARRKSKW